MAKPTRRESRETAFSLLFEWSFKEDSMDEIIVAAKDAGKELSDAFARELAEKTVEKQEEIDVLIEQYSQGRKLSRISKTALAVLRLCFCEMTQFKDIPAGASINEGVELLKKYGTDEEAAYLNGILGSFDRVRKGQKPASSTIIQYSDKDTNTEHNAHDTHDSYDSETANKIVEKDDVELIDDIVIEVD